jgi:hypothetical protein
MSDQTGEGKVALQIQGICVSVVPCVPVVQVLGSSLLQYIFLSPACYRHVDGCNNGSVVQLQLECTLSFGAISKLYPNLINITNNNLTHQPTIPPLHPPPPRTPSKNLAPHPPTPPPGTPNLHLHHLTNLSLLIPRLHLPSSNPRTPPRKPRIAGPRPLLLYALLRTRWFHLDLDLDLHLFPQPQPTYLFPTFPGKQNLLLPPKKRHLILRSPGPPLLTLPTTPTPTPKPTRSHKILRKRLSPRLALPHRLQLCNPPRSRKIPLYIPFSVRPRGR